MNFKTIMLGIAKRAIWLTGKHPRDPSVAEWLGAGGEATESGEFVTPDSALRVTAVYAAVRLKAESLASIPIKVQRVSDRSRTQDDRHPLAWVLRERPNAWQTPFEWIEMMTSHLELRGNSYSEILSLRGQPVSELIPLHPDRVTPFRAPDNRIAYEYRAPDGKSRIILQDEMHHWRGQSLDGITGLSPITLHRETVGKAMAEKNYGARFFKNNAVPRGVIEVPEGLSDTAYMRLKKDWQERQGGTNMHSAALLEDGMKFHEIGMSHADAQYIESQKFSVTDIARIFRVPPHMIGDLERSTNNNIEHQGIEFVVFTMLPLARRVEQAMRRDLMISTWLATHEISFVLDGLMRGDINSRYTAYARGRQWGWFSANDVRELENLNPIGESGDVYLSPSNMMPSDKMDEIPAGNQPANKQNIN
jgi:HK97 family phage portal protein